MCPIRYGTPVLISEKTDGLNLGDFCFIVEISDHRLKLFSIEQKRDVFVDLLEFRDVLARADFEYFPVHVAFASTGHCLQGEILNNF